MPTPKIDALCLEFIKRIPDQLTTDFTIGVDDLPDGYNVTALMIVDFVNRGMKALFEKYWTAVNGDTNAFIKLFPELVQTSEEEESPDYLIDAPHKDFHRLFGAITADEGTYLKVRPETEYNLFKAGKYKRYQPTEDDPVIICIQDHLYVFPETITEGIIFTYIRKPVDPDTGLAFEQNGLNDSPFSEERHTEIVDLAYNLFLAETKQTD